MDVASRMVLVVLGSAVLVGLVGFAVVSIRERERRASLVSAGAAAIGGGALLGATLLPEGPRLGAAMFVSALIALVAIVGVLPIGRGVAGNGRPGRRVDERGIMFARARLEPGTPNYDEYYAMRPEIRRGDDRTRSLPGLLSLDAKKAEPGAFASADASFLVTAALSGLVDGPVASTRIERTPAEAAGAVKDLALSFGAIDVGVTQVRDYHVYSHIGRGPGVYGEEIAVEHGWAIAFTVEMDHAVMRTAPEAPVVAESARRYVDAAIIGVRLAEAIREMGYPARAHIDGNYRVIAPLVAWDAGLGEIGRMGILMTPRLGPRVRLGVVTTDLPLNPDSPGDDSSLLDFCSICKKCAVNCPTNSIPFDDREPIDGGRRWALDAESCFRYWNVIGTDCGRCMTVCPYSHPDNPAHNLVRWMMGRSGTARRAGLWMDDLFYGRRPQP